MDDKELFDAFKKEIRARGWDVAEAMEKIGYGRATFFKWQNGERISNRGRAAMSVFVGGTKSNAEPVVEEIPTFPVISAAAAAENAGTCYYPISDWANDYAEQRVSFSEGRAGDFVIRVTGNSMLPWYPEGTLVLVRPNVRIRTKQRVVAVLDDGSVVFKVFAEKGDKIALYSINEADGKDFVFDKNNVTGIRAIYPVIQSMRDEQALDRAMDARGIRHGWEEKFKEL